MPDFNSNEFLDIMLHTWMKGENYAIMDKFPCEKRMLLGENAS
jgi:hypothetical protein